MDAGTMRHRASRRGAGYWLGLILLAVLMAESLTCSLSADPHFIADEALADKSEAFRFFIYCVRSFFTADVLSASCLTLLATGLLHGLSRLRATAGERGAAACFGLLFALMQLLGRSYEENASWDALFGSGFVLLRSAVAYAGLALLGGCLTLYFFRLLDRLEKPEASTSVFRWKSLFPAAGLIVLCWLPYYIFFFPGLGNPDTSMQIAWALHYPTDWLQYSPVRGETVFATNHHPYFTTLLFGFFAKAGRVLGGNLRTGVALYCLCQLLLTALVMTGVWFYLRRLGLSRGLFRGALVFTALFPLYPLYAITMLKDSLFSLACLSFSVLLFETARTRGERLRQNWFCLLLFMNALLVALTKNQGVYFVAAAGGLCLLLCGCRRRAAAALLLPVLLFQFVWTGLLLPAWNVAPGGKQEVLGLLFQQTARYVRDYPQDVSEAEAEAIRAVIDYDALPDLYKPHLADPVKFTFNQDATEEELSAYYRAWFQMLRRHPDAYLQALLSNVCGGFYTGHETGLSYTNFDNREVERYPELCIEMTPRQEAAEPVVQILLRAVQHIPGLGLLFSVGFYPWVILLLFLNALRRRRWREILPQLPAILSVAVLLVAPVSGSYRYAMPMIYVIPFLLAGSLLPIPEGPRFPEGSRAAALGRQIFRFGLVGGLCFLIDYILLALLVEAAGLHPVSASAVSFCVSVTVNYLLSMHFVFQRREDTGHLRELAEFVVLSAVGLGINELLMYLGTEGLGVHYLLVKIAATAIVMVYNFVSRKLLLERRAPEGK